MPGPIKWKSKLILAKAGSGTYGADSGPAAANAILAVDVSLQPMEGEDVSRNLEQQFLGAQETIPTGIRAVLTFSVEMVGSGTVGTPPAWGPLLRACAAAQVVTANTSVDYTPVTEGHEWVDLHFYIGPSRHILLGARGNAVLTTNAQGIPVIRYTLTGLFVMPADQARPAGVSYASFQGPQVATKANTPVFTIGGANFVMRNFELNLGNQVEPRLLVGFEGIIIVDKAETLTATVEAVPYAEYNPFAIALARTKQAIVLQHGTAAGKRVTITAGQAQQQRPGGLANEQNVVEWPLSFVPLPTDAGNDQWKISLT